MPLIPLPLVVALVLAFMLVRLLRSDGEAPPNPYFVGLLVVCAVQSVLVGLRWNFGFEPARLLLPVIAAGIPPVAYASFASLVGTRSHRIHASIIAVPPALIILLLALWPGALDIALIVIYLGFAAALLWLARQGPDALSLARFENVAADHKALVAGAVVLVASAFIDLLLAADIAWTEGRHATTFIAAANFLSPLVLGVAATVAGRSRVAGETAETTQIVPDMDDKDAHDIANRLDGLMREQHLYRDANLNLTRLSRRAGLTARRVSIAVNRAHHKNVSQFINGYRIAEALRLLRETGEPVTRIMFEAGFQTKSNFNREFRRVTGVNPVTWRAHNAAGK